MNAAPIELQPQPLQLRGSALARRLLQLAGWSVEFRGLPALQGVLVIYPHTSNWDFVVLIMGKWAVGLPLTFWSKDSLFRIPLFGAWLRRLGALPVRRCTPQGAVAHVVDRMRLAGAERRLMWLALSPEGTRRRTAGWRSGFYRVALDAGVPVALVALDYAQRRMHFDSFWRLSGDAAADMAVLAQRLAGTQGRHPQQAAPVRLLET